MSVRIGVATIVLGLLAACATAQQEYAAQPTEINVTNDNSHRYGELQLAVNPTNPDNIAMAVVALGTTTACLTGGDPMCEIVPVTFGNRSIPQPRGFFERDDFNLLFVYVSFDRSRTWERHQMPAYPVGMPHLTGQGDPSIVAAADGSFYVSWDANDWGTPERMLPSAGVAVSRSSDGGRTWSEPHLSGTPVDGPKLVSDFSAGIVYATSSGGLGPTSTGNPDAPRGGSGTRWVSSTRDGVNWTPPQAMGGAGSSTAAHGLFATAFKAAVQGGGFGSTNNAALCGSAPAPCTIFQTTRDAGATWSRHVVAIPSDYLGSPMLAADPSRPGHFALAIVRNRGGEFHVYETNDTGVTWTGPAIVTEDASKVHILPWMTYSREGVLGIVWRTRQPMPGQAEEAEVRGGGGAEQPPNPYNVWAAISRDGGATFGAPLRLSHDDSPPSPTRGPFSNSGDDYSAIAIDREYLYAGWADWRPGDRQNFFSAVRLDAFPARAR